MHQFDKESMISFLKKLVLINSHTHNIQGVNAVQRLIKEAAKPLKCKASYLKTKQFADILKLQKRQKAPIQILLSGHADTVFPKNFPFKRVKDTLYGPGVADMKGGLVILLNVLEAIERSPLRDLIGWTALINGDEESGSPGSAEIIAKEASGKHFALVFEPAKEGKFVDIRPSSTNYRFTAKGQKAHAGRDFHKGVNAILPLAKLSLDLSKLNSKKTQVLIAQISGGEALNIVPDHAELFVNIRSYTNNAESLVANVLKKHPSVAMQILTTRPAKELTAKQKALHRDLKMCGKKLGINVQFTKSGGVTDGNTIAFAGVPTLDSMGVVGKGLHTEHEEADAASIVERAQLAILLILYKAERLYVRS